ncbi:hypothetical protein ILYODFUR_004161 [Ilyodon furcidens]|uniref:Uncharacterized protein n=1 Tax=Ilyodon furcidens TaxID=33524 RepID=A0ABV0VAX6_9TELE
MMCYHIRLRSLGGWVAFEPLLITDWCSHVSGSKQDSGTLQQSCHCRRLLHYWNCPLQTEEENGKNPQL